jgi:Zn-dependent peptidase ImmA (M78 family)
VLAEFRFDPLAVEVGTFWPSRVRAIAPGMPRAGARRDGNRYSEESREPLRVILLPSLRQLERHGVVVVRTQTFQREVDAFSVNFPGRPVVVLGVDKAVTARSRFDAAHELGHLVLRSESHAGTKEAEKQAHRFGAAFLDA